MLMAFCAEGSVTSMEKERAGQRWNQGGQTIEMSVYSSMYYQTQ